MFIKPIFVIRSKTKNYNIKNTKERKNFMKKFLYSIKDKTMIIQRKITYIFMKNILSSKQPDKKGTYAMFKNIKIRSSQKFHKCKKKFFLIRHAINSITNTKSFKKIASVHQTFTSYYSESKYKKYLNTICTIAKIYHNLKNIYDIITFILSHFF